MSKFFFKIKHGSRSFAKERLHSLLESDRLLVKNGKTLEKIKKEVAAVLSAYSKEDTVPDVTVTYEADSQCTLAARILLAETAKVKEYRR